MFSRSALGAVIMAGLTATGVASSQIESESLGDLSAWGQRYLALDEQEYPSSLWRGSDDDTLLALMQSVRTSELSPAERRLLRRTILSPATRPVGSKAEALLAERARLMLELGEARAAAALVPQLEEETFGLDAETLAVDLDMASGQELTACSKLAGPVRDGAYWLKLRAVCAVLENNVAGAQIAIEFAEAQGVMDDWTVAAIFAASGDSPNAPNARYDTGVNIALSTKADLDTSEITVAADRPDLAAAVAQRQGVPIELRARFAETASEIGLIAAVDRRDILLARLDDSEYSPSSDLEQALKDLNDPLVGDEVSALSLAEVLQSAARGDLAQYRSTAELFAPDLERLPKNALTGDFALEFARAALMSGDRELSQSWLDALSIDDVVPADPYEVAVLHAVDAIARRETSSRVLRSVEKRLISTANSTPRENHAVNILTVWTGIGIPLSPIGRDFVSQTVDRGNRLAEGQQTALKAAARADAIGETSLMVLAMTQGEARTLAGPDIAILLETLIAIGAEDIALELGLEATTFWRKVE